MKYILLIITIASFLSCKTDTKPITYDNTLARIKQEGHIIHRLIDSGNLKEAGTKLSEYLKLYPDNSELIVLKLWLLIKQNKLNSAFEEAEKIYKKDPSNPLTINALAMICRLKGELDRSLELCKKGLSIRNNFAPLWFERGLSEYNSANYSAAYTSFNKAEQLDKTNIDATFYKYISAIYIGRDINTIKYIWTKLSSSENSKYYFYVFHTKALLDTGKIEDANIVIDEGLRRYKDNPYIMNAAAFTYIVLYKNNNEKNKDHLIKAEEMIKNAIAIKKDPSFVDTYCEILKTQNNHSEIDKIISEYIMLYPDNKNILKWLKFLHDTGDKK